jgi:plastocyanin
VNRWAPTVVAVLTLAFVTSARAQTIADPVSVSIIDAPRVQTKWGYAPVKTTVAAGTWVTWSNDGQESHTVTAIDGSFDSGNLDPSDGFSWYFDQPGTYQYTCSVHPWMNGMITVLTEPD